MDRNSVRFWPTVLTSSVVAATFSMAINLGTDIFYQKPYQRSREKAERSRAAAMAMLDGALPLHKTFGALFMQPTIRAIASDADVRSQAKTLLILADAVDSDCHKQPSIADACREYRVWAKDAVPLFERLSIPMGRPLAALREYPEAQRDALSRSLDAFLEKLKAVIEGNQ